MSSKKMSINNRNIWLFLVGGLMTSWIIAVIITQLYATTGIVVLGIILIIIGVISAFTSQYNREKIIGALKSYDEISLSHLSSETKLSKRKVKMLIRALRSEDRIRASFDSETDNLYIREVDGEIPIAIDTKSTSDIPEFGEKYVDKKSPKEHYFCQQCGSIVKPGDEFCKNCGSFIR